MRKLISLVALGLTIACVVDAAAQTSSKDGSSSKDKMPAGSIKLPIPDHEIPCDVSVWKDSFTILKVTHDQDNNQVVFLLKTKRAFKFTDDGFTAPLRFYDEDGVSLVKDANLKFEAKLTTLKVGENTRLYLTLPDEDTLKKTKKCQAVIKGFFADPDKKKK
jgi:hypothetical protein